MTMQTPIANADYILPNKNVELIISQVCVCEQSSII